MRIIQPGGLVKSDNMTVLQPRSLGAGVLFYDSFTDTNGVNLVLHTPDTDPLGLGWQIGILGSNYTIQSNRAETSDAGTALYYVQTSASDCLTTFTGNSGAGTGRDPMQTDGSESREPLEGAPDIPLVEGRVANPTDGLADPSPPDAGPTEPTTGPDPNLVLRDVTSPPAVILDSRVPAAPDPQVGNLPLEPGSPTDAHQVPMPRMNTSPGTRQWARRCARCGLWASLRRPQPHATRLSLWEPTPT